MKINKPQLTVLLFTIILTTFLFWLIKEVGNEKKARENEEKRIEQINFQTLENSQTE